MMIQAVLGNPNHPEYGVATIPFPIPHDQYAHCMELLEALEIGDAVKVDCISSKASSSSSFSSIGVSTLAYEAYFRSEMEQKFRMQSEESLRLHQKRLAQAEKRIGELDRLFIRIYEDNVAGRLDDERFAMMSKNYTVEQKDLKAEVKNLQQQIHEQEQQIENIEKFVRKSDKYVHIEELTPYALRELVSAIYVNAPDKSGGKRVQHIHIKYDGLGYIPLDELKAKEKA